jgi:hypothetical protein
VHSPSTHQTSLLNSYFESDEIAHISIRKYIVRIHEYAECSYETIVVGFMYVERLWNLNAISINSKSIHRILITSIVLAAKFMDDNHHSNKHFARVGGISVHELNNLEIRMMFTMKFDFGVTPSEFNACVDMIMKFSLLYDAQVCRDATIIDFK